MLGETFLFCHMIAKDSVFKGFCDVNGSFNWKPVNWFVLPIDWLVSIWMARWSWVVGTYSAEWFAKHFTEQSLDPFDVWS